MGRQKVMPPEELADQVRGPGYVWLDFGEGDESIKYECFILGNPGDEPEACFSVWLAEEVGTPGEQDYRLKHFPPGKYTAHFVESDDVTGLPIFERAYRFDARGKNLTQNPAGFGASGIPEKPATKKKTAPKSAAKKSVTKKSMKKSTQKPTKPAKAKKAGPRSTRNGGGKKRQSGK